jgi:hypothetical protein
MADRTPAIVPIPTASRVLGAGPGPIGAPGNDWQVAEIAHVETGVAERLDQSGVPQG